MGNTFCGPAELTTKMKKIFEKTPRRFLLNVVVSVCLGIYLFNLFGFPFEILMVQSQAASTKFSSCNAIYKALICFLHGTIAYLWPAQLSLFFAPG